MAGQKIRLAAWHGLHLRKLPALVGMVLRVEFLKADDTPRYLLTLGTPAAAPRPAGKGHGRAKGYRPQPKKRHPVGRKSPQRVKQGVKQRKIAV